MGRYGRRRPPCGDLSRGHTSRPQTCSKKRVVSAFHCIANAVTHMQGALFNMQVNMERTAHAVNCVAHALGEQVPIVDGIEQRMCMLESTLANRYHPTVPLRQPLAPRLRPSFGRRVDGICSDPVAAHYHFRSGRLKPCSDPRRESRRECRRESRRECRRPSNTPNFPSAHTPYGWKGADSFVSSDPGITICPGIKNRLSPGPPKTSSKMQSSRPSNQFAPRPTAGGMEPYGSNWNPSRDNAMNDQNRGQFESHVPVEPFEALRPSYNPSVWSGHPTLIEQTYSPTPQQYSGQMSTESKSLQSSSYNQIVTDDYQAADESSYSSHKILSDSISRDHGMAEMKPVRNGDSSYPTSSSRRVSHGRSQSSEHPSSTIGNHLSRNNMSRSEQKSFFEDDWSRSQMLDRGFTTNGNYSASQLQMSESPGNFTSRGKISARSDFSMTSPLSSQGKVSLLTSSNAPSASRGKSSSPSGMVVGEETAGEQSRDQPIDVTRHSSQSLDRSSSSLSQPSSKVTSGSKDTSAQSYSKNRDRSIGQPEGHRSNEQGLTPWSTISSPSTKNVETLYPRSAVYSTVFRSLSTKDPSGYNLRLCPTFAPRSTSSSRSSSSCRPLCPGVRPATVPRADGVPEGPQRRRAPRPAKASQGPSKRLANLGKSLLNAAQDGRVEAVRNLLNEGADPNFTFGSDWTALHRACAKGHAAVVALLLQRGACPHTRVHSFTPLHMAAYEDLSGRCVAHLLEAGARPNCRNAYGRTPIHYAAQSGNEAAIRALVEVGACKSPRDGDGRTPFDLAKTHCVRRLLKPYCSKKRTSQ